MLSQFAFYLKKYLAEILLGISVCFVVIVVLIANTWLSYVLGCVVLASLIYILLQLREATKQRLNRLLELDNGNRNQLLNRKEAFNPDTVVEEINNNLRYATEFVREIGKGNFEARLEGITDENFDLNKDNLAGELVNMKVKMRASAEEEKKRVWATQGLANFSDLLRTSSHDLAKLSEGVIMFIVKYLGANQGGIFILNNEQESDKFLELKASYAFERKKYLTKRIQPGEGLVGQAFLEKETIHLRKIPANYISITSGLGGANPHTLILVPLKIEENVLGVMEIASFKNFQDHEIEFCERIGETIASTISSTQINEQTRNLLEQSQQQSEEMKAQEEEMRQNMEELQATQEEMGRKEKDYIRIIEELEESISNASSSKSSGQEEALKSSLTEAQTELDYVRQKNIALEEVNKKLLVDLELLSTKQSTQSTDNANWTNISTLEKDLATSLEATRIALNALNIK